MIKGIEHIIVAFCVVGSLWYGFVGTRAQAQRDERTIFQIGKRDRSFSEFAKSRKPGKPVVYETGKSSPGADWFAYQPGSLDYQVGRSTREQSWVENKPGSSGDLAKDPMPIPFEVKFSLGSEPQ